MLEMLRNEVEPDLYAALNDRGIELTGRPLDQLPDDELRGCLEQMRAEVLAVLSSQLVPSGV